ncbi:hypothetical protein QAD02_000774 [Eretmocerus hayati]|uniref:Uncharacterized protein n=1 Tax=Eretmocerus hayati TaxID=131215 RepID=A0ACC2NEC4_9HYME|nr:hypothetical protein QAD02_000774 [Eretmocerus hayati]
MVSSSIPGSTLRVTKRLRKKLEITEKAEKELNALKINDVGRINLPDINRNTEGATPVNRATKFVRRADPKKRIYTKYKCYICDASVTGQIWRHIRGVHQDYHLIKDAAKMGPMAVTKVIQGLVNLCTHDANSSNAVSEFKPARRPNAFKYIKVPINQDKTIVWPKNLDPSQFKADDISHRKNSPNHVYLRISNLPEQEFAGNYVPCPYCKRDFIKRNLYKHVCRYKPQENPQNSNRKRKQGVLTKARACIPDSHEMASDALRNRLYKNSQSSEIITKMKNDPLIVAFGNSQLQFHTSNKDNAMVKTSLSNLAELTVRARKKDPSITELQVLLDHKKDEFIATTIGEMCCYDKSNGSMEKANKCRWMGTLLKKVIKFFKNECSREKSYVIGDTDDRRLSLIKLGELMEDVMKYLNRSARDSLLLVAKNKPPIQLPTQDAINQLIKYIDTVREEAHAGLLEGYTAARYLRLMEALLVLFQVFNRKRQGEMSRLKKKTVNLRIFLG